MCIIDTIIATLQRWFQRAECLTVLVLSTPIHSICGWLDKIQVCNASRCHSQRTALQVWSENIDWLRLVTTWANLCFRMSSPSFDNADRWNLIGRRIFVWGWSDREFNSHWRIVVGSRKLSRAFAGACWSCREGSCRICKLLYVKLDALSLYI